MATSSSPEARPAAADTDWALVALLFCAGLLAAAQFGKVSLALGAWAAAYPERAAEVPLLISAVGVVGIVLGVVAGAQVGRIGVRRSLAFALLLGGAASLAQGMQLPFWLLLVTRFAEGLSHLVIVVAAPTLMAAAASDRDRPAVMGLWGMFFGVSFAALAMVLPALLAAGGVAAVALAQGVALLVVAAALVPRLPPAPTPTAVPAPPEGFLAAHRAAYGTPRRLAPAAGFLWHTLAYIALLTYLPAALPPGAPAVLPLASLAGTFGAGALSRWVPPARIVLLSFAATPPLMAATLAAPPALAIPVAALTFVVMGLVPGASFAAVPWFNPGSPDDQARANGAIAQLGNVGTTCGTPLLAASIAAGPGLLGFTTACSVLGLLSLGLLLRHPALDPAR